MQGTFFWRISDFKAIFCNDSKLSSVWRIKSKVFFQDVAVLVMSYRVSVNIIDAVVSWKDHWKVKKGNSNNSSANRCNKDKEGGRWALMMMIHTKQVSIDSFVWVCVCFNRNTHNMNYTHTHCTVMWHTHVLHTNAMKCIHETRPRG